VMAEIFANVRKPVKQLQASGLISYKLAWTYFPKDCIVYSPGKDCERIYKIVDTVSQTKPKKLVVRAKEIVFDGSKFVWKDVQFCLPPWTGNKPIDELSHFPLEFHKDPESVQARLRERGKKVLDYQGLKYSSYTGLGLYVTDEGTEKHNVSSHSNKILKNHLLILRHSGRRAYYH
jgi:hypothetical protein